MSARERYDDAGVIDFEDLPRQTGVFPLTDAGNGEYFTARCGDLVRRDFRRERWLVWQGHHWQPDADAQIRRLALDAVRGRLREAVDLDDDATRKAAVKWCAGSECRSRLESLLWFAASLAPIADAGDRWDTDPWLLGTGNAVVDLRTGEARRGRRDDRITMTTAVPFNADATCPRWERFLSEVFGHDAALVDFVHRALGYSLTGDVSEQCLFLCYGTGSNGKSTLLTLVGEVLGDYAYSMPFSTVELHQRAAIPNDLAALVNRRFVTASETNDGTRLNESRLKALTGADPLTARFLHSEFFTFRPVGKYWLAANHKPVVRDDSFGFWRRMRVIPFMERFPVNPGLADELRAEAPGILAWLVRGCLAWQERGLDPPAVVTSATSEYETDSDPLAAFVEECCTLDATAQVAASDLYQSYRRWAERHGLSDRERLTATMFGRKLGERFPRDRDRATGTFYRGIGRRPDTP